MKEKKNRLEALKMLISSQELGSQEEVLLALKNEGIEVTQATLSRDLKQLKVAKAASMNGHYVYVLPNETMYKRVRKPQSAVKMMTLPGMLSITFSGNLAVIRTRPGYASSIAYNIDNGKIKGILGTIAGDDTIIIVVQERYSHENIVKDIKTVLENI
jgi:transcriptional regulator of arginine metabolism